MGSCWHTGQGQYPTTNLHRRKEEGDRQLIVQFSLVAKIATLSYIYKRYIYITIGLGDLVRVVIDKR